jgi:HTH-type transcriptional regulator / antitoxin HigA
MLEGPREEVSLTMRTVKHRAVVPGNYFKLVTRFPLRSIKSAQEHEAAVKVLSRLAVVEPGDTGTRQYMETLAQLIDGYERGAGLKLDTSGVSPRRILRHLMDEHGLTVTALGRIVGSQGTLSDVLAGRRELSKAMIRKLADHFGVSPAVFL